ncbi:hypothetical protein [Rudanella lutea]|uniref:hypothetical protein n=1 Tax=Rudanella lutea TaxID=451374 RepID=UPI00039D6B45|nr:hypothetical protein [Rudanella lutea]
MKRFMGGLVALLGLLIRPAHAQETFFNVSESEITAKKKVMIQQQIDYTDLLHSGTTFDYGLGRNWEIGINLYHLNFQPDIGRFVRNDTSSQQPYAPLLLLNAQKIFDLTDNLRIGIGGQGGVNLTPAQGRSALVGYGYANLAGSFSNEQYKWAAGAYTSHPRFTGEGAKVGFQAGFDAGIFYEKLHLIGDWISGQHEMGQLILGLEVFPRKSLPLAIGWQRNNQNGAQGIVIQLSYIPQAH